MAYHRKHASQEKNGHKIEDLKQYKERWKKKGKMTSCDE